MKKLPLHYCIVTACLTLPLLFPVTVAAHAALHAALPAAGSSLASAPKTVLLTFSEKLEAAFSSVHVRTASGTLVSGTSTLDPAAPNRLLMPLPHLASGTYAVEWVAVTHDGHRRKGTYQFTVR